MPRNNNLSWNNYLTEEMMMHHIWDPAVQYQSSSMKLLVLKTDVAIRRKKRRDDLLYEMRHCN